VLCEKTQQLVDQARCSSLGFLVTRRCLPDIQVSQFVLALEPALRHITPSPRRPHSKGYMEQQGDSWHS